MCVEWHEQYNPTCCWADWGVGRDDILALAGGPSEVPAQGVGEEHGDNTGCSCDSECIEPFVRPDADRGTRQKRNHQTATAGERMGAERVCPDLQAGPSEPAGHVGSGLRLGNRGNRAGADIVSDFVDCVDGVFTTTQHREGELHGVEGHG